MIGYVGYPNINTFYRESTFFHLFKAQFKFQSPFGVYNFSKINVKLWQRRIWSASQMDSWKFETYLGSLKNTVVLNEMVVLTVLSLTYILLMLKVTSKGKLVGQLISSRLS